MLERGDQAGEYRPRISEWSTVVAELANISDRVAELTYVTLGAYGGKPQRPKPRPRPTTAIDRLREQDRAQVHAGLVKRLVRRSGR